MDDQEQAHAQDAKRCTCAALPEPPNDDCSIHGLCETCGAEPDGKCMFPTSSGIDPCRTVPPAPLTPAACSRQITLTHDHIFNGIRIDAGTYEIRRIDAPQAAGF
jgi:hypothetical protein